MYNFEVLLYSAVAQLVERLAVNEDVLGSSPSRGAELSVAYDAVLHMNIKIFKEPVALEDVRVIAQEIYRDMVKGVVDVERGAIALGGEWHMDANAILISDGSKQENVWGFNIHVYEHGDSALKFVSLINIRPTQGNRGMEIQDEELRKKIRAIVERLIPNLFV